VCEAAAILGSNHGKLIIPKVKGKNWTAALAIDEKHLRQKKGHIEIVGAGLEWWCHMVAFLLPFLLPILFSKLE